MKELATQVLRARAGGGDGLGRMFGVSVGAHVIVLLAIVLMPADWDVRAEDDPGPVMTISLGGPAGPETGGLTPLGGRPVQQITELPPDPRPRAVRVPARAEPEMTVPEPAARRREVPNPPDVERSPEGARGQTRAEDGDELRAGSALSDTGVQGLGFGLSTGGGGGSGGYLDVASFCCPEYVATMLELIRRTWNARQQVTGDTMMKFTIQRDGRVVDVEVERSSGYVALDLAAQRALALTALPPLPSAFPENTLPVHLSFQYQR